MKSILTLSFLLVSLSSLAGTVEVTDQQVYVNEVSQTLNKVGSAVLCGNNGFERPNSSAYSVYRLGTFNDNLSRLASLAKRDILVRDMRIVEANAQSCALVILAPRAE